MISSVVRRLYLYFWKANETPVETNAVSTLGQDSLDEENSAYDEETLPEFWRALLVGISYQHHHNKKAHLNGTHGDVERMKNFLIDQGWPEENIIILTDKESIEPTSAAGILGGIKALIKPAVDNPRQCYRFVFYYAGHGAQEPDPYHVETDDNNEALVTTDGVMPPELLVTSPEGPAATPWDTCFQIPAFRPRGPYTKLIPSDCDFEVQERRDPAGKLMGGSDQAGAKPAAVIKALPTGNGWIIDDQLREHLCVPLNRFCRLRAFFDMCHSGTPLDLPRSYQEKHIPWSPWLLAIMPEMRKGFSSPKKFKLPPFPGSRDEIPYQLRRVKSFPSSWPPLPRPRGARGLPHSGLGVMLVRWIARILKNLLGWPRTVKPDVERASPANSAQTHDVLNPSTGESLHFETSSVVTASTKHAASSESNPSLRPSSISAFSLPFFRLAKSVPSTPAAMNTTSLPSEPQPDRPASAPPLAPIREPVRADVICIGATQDDGVSSDSRSLATAFTTLYNREKRENLTYARLLVKLARSGMMGTGQIPQMSASYPLDAHWDQIYTL